MSTPSPEKAAFIRNFTDGFMDSPESDTLPLGATPDAKNAFLYNIDVARRRAVMGRRAGSRMVLSTAVVSGKVWDGLFEWLHDAAQDLLGVINGGLYKLDIIAQTATLVGTGWTASTPARLTPFRGDAFIYDGTYQQRYDGTTLYPVGSAAPSVITNMVVGAGPGPTGTYEALYCWYNGNRLRYSSPSDITGTLALVNQGRTHTKPGSAAPTWATHWAAFVRRTDTGELNFYFAGQTAIANATFTETASDVVRQRGVLSPLPSSHDAPPGAWIVLAEHKGYGIGILPSTYSINVSALGDFESWHPKDEFPVARAAGSYLCWGRQYGTEFLLGTSRRTWRLDNDQVPFKPVPVNPRFGNVSQDACLEVKGEFFGWDALHGPYRTNLVDWNPIGRHRIDDTLATVNRTALSGIKAIHAEKYGLIGWAVPTTTTRRATVLWYHYDLDCWLPPWTGLEYGSMAEFTDVTGSLGIFCGDYWGRLYELFSGSKEGVPTTAPTDNLRNAAVVSATSGTVTVDNALLSLYTTGSGLAGLPVAAVSPTGAWQWRRVQSNTGNVIVLDTTNGSPWDIIPDTNYRIIVGGIEWFWWTPWIDFGIPHIVKVLRQFYVQARASSADHLLQVSVRFNNNDGVVSEVDFSFSTSLNAGIWDESRFDVALFAETQRQIRKKSLPQSPLTVQFRFSNSYPDQEIKIPLYGVSADVLPGMQVPSV